MRFISRIEPLALETIGAAVSREHDVRLVDMQVRPADLEATLGTFTPDVVGVTSEAVRAGQALEVLRTVRHHAPECLTVVGGQHATTFPEFFLDPVVDLIVQGEGVTTFREICEARAAGATDFRHVAGLLIPGPNGLEATEPRPAPTTLDDQPLPDRSLSARYRKHYYYILEPHTAAVRTSYGCAYNCSFCPSSLYSKGHFHVRDPKRLFEEICSVKEPFVFFADNGSFHDVDRMRRLGQMLLNAGVKKRYLTYVRADTIARNPELFELWARAGLSIAMIGLEALDQKSLKEFRKGTNLSQNERAVRMLEDLGITISGGFLVRPTDGPDEFDRIDNYIKEHPSIIHAEFTPLTPFPGTNYFETQKETVLSQDWEVFDMQHFVQKTRLPVEELYRLMIRSYRKVVMRQVFRDWLWLPIRGLRQRKWRVLRGLLANGHALSQAHLHVPEVAAATGPQPETAHAA
jgi:radical SAM superfamily enzyme YgiQ (UPF0313 family)